MIWKRLKKSTPEQEKQFAEQMKEAGVSPKDKLLMTLTAYVVILLPCLLVLLGLSVFMLWILGLLSRML